MDKIKREREKVEFTLTTKNADNDTKKQLEGLTEAQIAKAIQSASNCNIRSVRKSHNTITVRCTTESKADSLRNFNWNLALPGTEVTKSMYGIVIHGVPIYDIDFGKDDMEEIKT